MKKILAILLSLTMLASSAVMLGGCGETDVPEVETPSSADVAETPAKDPVAISVWAPENTVDLTQKALDEWQGGLGEEYAHYDITVSAMGEGDAATQMLTDVEAGADVFGFAQDQLARLVSVGALSKPGGVFLENINNNNDAGSISAATSGETVYAYPETSDNGYFLFYDSSVITDTSSIEAILEQCNAAGKKIYMDLQSGWYNTAWFFGAGAECYYELDDTGAFTGCVCDYNGDAGLAAFKAMIAMAADPAHVQLNSDFASKFNPEGGDAAAAVTGTWDAAAIEEFLGENYAACKLPTFTVDGNEYQMGGFGGFKLVGVKPQNDSDKLVFCHMVADYITSEEMQVLRFNELGWGPSNLNAQALDAVQSNPALAALADQLQYTIGQGQYPNAYWTLTEAFGTDINNGLYDGMTDEELLDVLAGLQADLEAAQ